jgi:AbrB family looped-hinge helix DNA binding protein
MKTTMDKRGRIVIPKALREETGMLPGTKVDIFYEDGKIRIRHISTQGHMEKALQDTRE